LVIGGIKPPAKGSRKAERQSMSDLIFIFATVGFFLVSILYTYACGKL
jgi:hypothetical protein